MQNKLRIPSNPHAARLAAAGYSVPCWEKCDGCSAEIKCPDCRALPKRILCEKCYDLEVIG
jgi:hypothetical protein